MFVSQVSFVPLHAYQCILTFFGVLYRILDDRETPIDILWNDTLQFYSGYTYQSLEPVVGRFCSLVIKSETSKFQVIFKT